MTLKCKLPYTKWQHSLTAVLLQLSVLLFKNQTINQPKNSMSLLFIPFLLIGPVTQLCSGFPFKNEISLRLCQHQQQTDNDISNPSFSSLPLPLANKSVRKSLQHCHLLRGMTLHEDSCSNCVLRSCQVRRVTTGCSQMPRYKHNMTHIHLSDLVQIEQKV